MDLALKQVAQLAEEAYLNDEIDQTHYGATIAVIKHLSLRDSVKKKLRIKFIINHQQLAV